MKILIDADACPVVELAVRTAAKRGLPVILLCDTAHAMNIQGAQTITVDQGADSVDFALVNRVEPGDIVITQDYGLAAMVLAKGGRPLHHNGMVYTADNIDSLLLGRHIARKVRSAGGRLKGPARRTKEQDGQFCHALEALLQADRKTAEP
mgnify:CR=1 FL=1